MHRLMKTPEYAKWVKLPKNIKKAYHLVWNGRFKEMEDQSSLMMAHDYTKKSTKRQRAKLDPRGFDDVPRMRYLCPVFVVTHFLEALYVWNAMCATKNPISAYLDKDRVLIRIGGFAYMIPKSALVNRFWFENEAGERLLRIALWDLINRTPEVQEYVEDRNTREADKDNATMLEKAGMGL